MRANTLWKKYMPKSNRAPESGLLVVVVVVVWVLLSSYLVAVAWLVVHANMLHYINMHAQALVQIALKKIISCISGVVPVLTGRRRTNLGNGIRTRGK